MGILSKAIQYSYLPFMLHFLINCKPPSFFSFFLPLFLSFFLSFFLFFFLSFFLSLLFSFCFRKLKRKGEGIELCLMCNMVVISSAIFKWTPLSKITSFWMTHLKLNFSPHKSFWNYSFESNPGIRSSLLQIQVFYI